MSLYKYVIPDRTDILRNAVIRFTQQMALHDPFDMRPYFENFGDDTEIYHYFFTPEVLNGDYEFGYQIALKFFHNLETDFPGVLLLEPYNEIRKDIPPRKVSPDKAKQAYSSMVTRIVKFVRENTPALRDGILTKTNQGIGILCLTEANNN